MKKQSHYKLVASPVRISRSGLRKGLRLCQEKKRSIRLEASPHELLNSITENTHAAFYHLRHHGSWWKATVLDWRLLDVDIVTESFRFGVMNLVHRYIRFQFQNESAIKLEGQEEANAGQEKSINCLLFSPEGVAEDHRVLFLKSMIPSYYSVAYCFRTGDYLEHRSRQEGIEVKSINPHLDTKQQNELIHNCLLRSHTRQVRDEGNFLHGNCATSIYEEVSRVTGSDFHMRGWQKYPQNIAHHFLDEKKVAARYFLQEHREIRQTTITPAELNLI